MKTKTRITLAEANNFVNVATTLCHDKNGVYNPVLKDFAIKYSILAHFTDYPIDSKGVEEIYSDIYNAVTDGHIRNIMCDSIQLSALISAEISISLDTGAEPVSLALAASIIGRTASISA